MFLTKIQKESLNSDGHQCHKYQQDELSAVILTELPEHKKRRQHMMLESRSWLGTGTKTWQH